MQNANPSKTKLSSLKRLFEWMLTVQRTYSLWAHISGFHQTVVLVFVLGIPKCSFWIRVIHSAKGHLKSQMNCRTKWFRLWWSLGIAIRWHQYNFSINAFRRNGHFRTFCDLKFNPWKIELSVASGASYSETSKITPFQFLLLNSWLAKYYYL